jgi:hypothetical protein
LGILSAEFALVNAFPTAEYLATLIKKSSDGVEKRSPWPTFRTDLEAMIEKRSALNPRAAPVQGNMAILVLLVSGLTVSLSDR